jgi:GGDEF domain-containing protein
LRINTTTLLSSAEDALGTAVRGRSWDWLRLLCARLNIEVHLVNAQGGLLPLNTQQHPSSATQLITAHGPALRAAVAAALQGKAPQALAIDGLQIVCVRVAIGDEGAGVLVLTKALPPSETRTESTPTELEIVAQWLVPAITAHAQSPAPRPIGADRVGSLLAVFDAAATTASDRDLILAFADALAVWHDLEVTGYVETEPGRFTREVGLPGTDPGSTPTVIAARDLPTDLVPSTLVHVDADRLGMDDTDGLMLLRLDVTEQASWLLLIRILGSEPPDESRLDVYVRILEQWLAVITAQATLAATGAVGRTLLEQQGSSASVAERALDETRTQIRAEAAWLDVTVDGRLLLQAGTRPAKSDQLSDKVMPLGGGSTLTLSALPRPGMQFSPLERRILTAVAELLQHWARQLVTGESRTVDRRTLSRRLDEVIDRFAQQAIDRGTPVAVVVIRLAAEAAGTEAAQQRVAAIRSQVRPSDLVGILGQGEIGVLLHETSPEQAVHVARRLCALVDGAGPGRSVAAAGLATRVPGGDAVAAGVVQEAREHGLERSVA